MTRFMHYLVVACAATVLGGTAHADLFTGDGDGTSWEDPDNWGADAVPLNNGSGNTFINGGHNVDFDTDTWTALDAAGNLQGGMGGSQYRVVRFILNENTSSGPIGTNSLNFSFGDGREVLQTNSTSAVFGGRNGSDTTVNVASGTVNTGSRTSFGARTGAMGTLNVTGGEFIVGRSNLQLGINNAFDTTTGTGVANISGGVFRTREGVAIGGTSTFHVQGSGATEIGVGSQGSVDGRWNQAAGGILRTGIDAGTFPTILIDDVDDDGGGAQGNAIFDVGSILDPYDAGGAATNVWHTVMTWEGTLTGLPDLSATALADGWERQVSGNNLQVRLVAIPEPGAFLMFSVVALAVSFRNSARNRKGRVS